MSGKQVRVVVADDPPVNRSLVRYFLENGGYQVVGETSNGDELVAMAGTTRPDAVVLGEGLPGGSVSETIRRIKEASPSTKAVLFSPTGRSAAAEWADAVLEKGVGLKDLTSTIAALCLPSGAAAAPAAVEAPPPPPRVREGRRRPAPALAASLAVLALAILVILRVWPTGPAAPSPSQATPRPVPSPGTSVDEARLRLETAFAELDDLVAALRGGSFTDIAGLARALMLDRSAAIAAGADVSRLDARIASLLFPLPPALSLRSVWALEAILGPLLPHLDLARFGEAGGTGGTETGGAGSLLSGEGGTSGGGGTGGGTTTGGGGSGGGTQGGTGETTVVVEPVVTQAPAPSNGLHLGWVHKPPQGGWHYGWSNSPRK